MAKGTKVVFQYVCQDCGNGSPRWLGKCPGCGAWNSYVQERMETGKGAGSGGYVSKPDSRPVPITEVTGDAGKRTVSGIAEFDRILGGGFVPGSVVLVGGDPGIGKSTLALQMLESISRGGASVLYVTGEESPEQVKLRAERLGVTSPSLLVYAETSLESVLERMEELSPAVVVIDSIQAVNTFEFPSGPGSVGQIRECASKLIQYAKTRGTAVFLIGHVTKDGAIAGPKVLEHLVDTVLYFEGGKESPFRILRAVKNRFGSTNEIGVFEMKESGLEEVTNPSEIFLSERPQGASGSVVVPSLEGTRPILVELQALVTPCAVGVPRRTTIGLDHNRVSLLAAVLEKRAGVAISGNDIFMNVPGGVKIDEPAIDLGISVSLASSLFNKPVAPEVVVFGEIGLAGEVRAVSQPELRLKEAEKLGFKGCLLPQINLDRMKSGATALSLLGVRSIDEAVRELF